MLKNIELKDIYIGQTDSWISGVPGTLDPIPAPEDCLVEINDLREICENYVQQRAKDEFALNHDGVAYRVSVLRSIAEVVYILRRFPSTVPALDSLGIHQGYVSKLMTPNISGLVIIAGAYGQGKTTTASAIISARLAKFGGICVSIEDPPEMPLQGRHGEGVCFQRWVDQGDFASETRRAARYAPSIIFLGEVRDSETATEALRASINGRLVICTIHSDTVPMAIERIFALANGEAGTSEDTASLLASGLLCVAHQRLEGQPKHPKVSFLWLGDEESQGVRNTIRQKRFDQIASEVTLQLNRMMMARKA